VIGLAYRHVPTALSPEKTLLVRSLRKLGLDWAVVLESHRSFVELGFQASPARLVAYGTIPGRKTEKARFDPNMHSIENHLRVGEELLGVRPAGLEMELHYPQAAKGLLEARLAQAGVRDGEMLVGLHAGWGGRPQSLEETRLRSWPPKRFATAARWLTETLGARVVLTGSADDRPLTEFIAQHAGVPCLNLAGSLSILELAALIDRLAAYVAIESGPAHMAAALGTPLVALLGPAIFQQTRPLTERGTVHVLRHQVPCAPCYGTPLLKRCKDNICMKQIEVSEVQEAIMAALAQGKNK
jgi:ADP-heptose:LPS heptosyltransferase